MKKCYKLIEMLLYVIGCLFKFDILIGIITMKEKWNILLVSFTVKYVRK